MVRVLLLASRDSDWLPPGWEVVEGQSPDLEKIDLLVFECAGATERQTQSAVACQRIADLVLVIGNEADVPVELEPDAVCKSDVDAATLRHRCEQLLRVRTFEQSVVHQMSLRERLQQAAERPESLDELASYYQAIFSDVQRVARERERKLRAALQVERRLRKELGRELAARKQAEKALRESEAEFRLLAENIKEVFYIRDAKTLQFLYISPAVQEVLGTSPESLYKNPAKWIESVVPEEQERVRAAFAQMKGGRELDMEYRVRLPDGTKRVIYSRSFPVRNEQGKIWRVVGTAEDITERTLAEERYRKLFDEAPLMYVITHDEGGRPVVSDCNKMFCAVLGYRREEVLGRPLTDFYTAESARQLVAGAFQRALEGSFSPEERELVTRDGRVVTTLLRAGPEMDSKAQSYGTRAVYVDITARKQAEAALRRSEEQLRQSQKMEAVGKLAGGVAHDFNNVLTAITGYTTLLLRSLDKDDPLREDVGEIEKAALRAGSLTRQLLAFSRRQVLRPQVMSFNLVVANIEKMLRRLVGEDIDLATVLDPELGPVKADPGQIEQVILNLVVNARDAMPRGGKITIETAELDLDERYCFGRENLVEPGRYAVLAVTDNGSGMDEETRSRIFEPFFTTKGQGEGTGLGLSTVYGIVKQSGGYIWVYSEPGRGTTFKTYLPRVEGAVAKSKPSGEPPEMPGGSETILLVEDEAMVRTLARRVLEKVGYTVLEARNGGEGLLMCERHEEPIHLLVTDVVMPQMNGRDLAQRLTPLRPEMKVLYMSGYTDEAIVRHGVLEPRTAFLEKPFTPDTLVRKVRQLLNTRPEAEHEERKVPDEDRT